MGDGRDNPEEKGLRRSGDIGVPPPRRADGEPEDRAAAEEEIEVTGGDTENRRQWSGAALPLPRGDRGSIACHATSPEAPMSPTAEGEGGWRGGGLSQCAP